MHPPREKPHRLPRASYCGDVTVAITACLANRNPLFVDPNAIAAMLDILRSVAKRHQCTVPVYCFMPEHVHLMLSGQSRESDTWQAMIDFKQASGFWLKQHAPGVFWQKDFYDHIVRRKEDLGAQIRYIAGNPVRRGLVADWRDYPHTGAIGIDLREVISSTITL